MLAPDASLAAKRRGRRGDLGSPRRQGDLAVAVQDCALSDLDRERPKLTDVGVLNAPIGIFADGVPTVKQDSCIGFFVLSAIAETRFLVGILRKRNLCHCDCRGWRSFAIMGTYLTSGPQHSPKQRIHCDDVMDLSGGQARTGTGLDSQRHRVASLYN